MLPLTRLGAALGLALLASAVLLRAQSAAPAPAQPVDFVRDIQPILKQYCYECHGASKSRGKLRLHSPDLILRGGESGAIVTPGKSAESLIVRRLLGQDGDDQMPKDADPLSPAAVALVRAWIDQGAAMPGVTAAAAAAAEPPVEDHWAYARPKHADPPEVKNPSWPRSAIDRFILAGLDREGLSPSPEASKTTLLRRVTLDLTGLPPSPAEIDAFLADRSAGAYDAVVDRLLASPRYGERWARPWLDLARYADTNGYEKDSRRVMWKYRDWVVDALNRDMPFDQFTIEQIAGDMLPNATTEQKIASGFHRNAMTNEEGGVDPDESMYETLVDRVGTTATVWLGTTLACAQCHNHKYDPFTQKDYFRLLAFFANSEYESRTFGDGTRFSEARLELPAPEDEKTRVRLQADIDRLDAELKTVTPEVRQAQEEWERTLRGTGAIWTPLAPREAHATNGVVLKTLPDQSVLATGPNPSLTTYTITAETTLQGITGVRLEALPDPSLPRNGPGRDGYGHFRVTGLRVEIAPLSGTAATSVAMRTVRVDEAAYSFDPAELLGSESAPKDRKNGSWAINAMRDTDRLPRQAVLPAQLPFGFPGGTRITIRIDHLDGTIGQGIGRLRLSATTDAAPLAGADIPARLRPVLNIASSERTTTQAEDLAAFFRSSAPILKPTRDALSAARRKLADVQIPSALVMKEKLSYERPSYELRVRGSYTAKGPRVYAGTPTALHPMRDDQPVNRLGLARWLVDDRNPLVARVAVNRLWEQVFGRGLVETSEDFGTQGAAPSNQALLDWLATEFMEKGWSQKTILRLVVTSSSYRQSSAATPQLVERDPYNRLIARGPRFRMEAEMVRDVALAASGLLSPKMHGPSVFPPQPPGIWNQPYSSEKWTTSEGEDRYRRSLYTFWRRTSPYPSFMTFDATSREYCTVRRVRTDTPLQALTLLNDDAAFEAARALAERMQSAGPDPRASAAFGVKLVLSRAATAAEIDRLVAIHQSEQAHYDARPYDALDVIGRAAAARATDLAAWTIVANVLLNLDEAVTKE